jgi:peptidoglycan/LPS O-acetylase OafA/YrhL
VDVAANARSSAQCGVIRPEHTDEVSQSEPLLRPKMPELDVIRGIASLAVLFYHGLYYGRSFAPFTTTQRRILFAFSPGQFGVNLFFVLSGFLITGLLLDSRNRADYYRRFYVRRALRILPAYYGILLVLALTHAVSNGFLAMSLFYCANFSQLFGIWMSYPVLWSLAVEEQFYLVWPTVVHRFTARWLAIVAVTMVIASPLFRFWCAWQAQHTDLLASGCYYYTWNNVDGLACGALLAIAMRKFSGDRRRVLQLSLACLGLAAMIALAGAPYGIVTRQTLVGSALQGVPWNIGFTGIIGLVVLMGTSRWKGLVTQPVLIFFGNVSYGLYIVHPLVFSTYNRFAPEVLRQSLQEVNSWPGLWLRFAIAGAAAVGVSYLSRWYFEERFLRLKERFT